VRELPLEYFAGVRVQDGDLLLARVQIAANQDHELGLLLSGVVMLGSAEPISNAGPFS
jgi:hypothetical protein